MLEDARPCANADAYCFNEIFDKKKLDVKTAGRAAYQQAGVGLRTPWPQAPSASGRCPPSSPGLCRPSLGDTMFPQPSLGPRDRGQPQSRPAQRLGRAPGPACFSSRLCPKADFQETGRAGGQGACHVPPPHPRGAPGGRATRQETTQPTQSARNCW